MDNEIKEEVEKKSKYKDYIIVIILYILVIICIILFIIGFKNDSRINNKSSSIISNNLIR